MGALKNMVTKLQGIIGEVKNAARNIASASRELKTGSELMSRGAGEQANRATQVATASEEMSQTVLDIAKIIKHRPLPLIPRNWQRTAKQSSTDQSIR